MEDYITSDEHIRRMIDNGTYRTSCQRLNFWRRFAYT